MHRGTGQPGGVAWGVVTGQGSGHWPGRTVSGHMQIRPLKVGIVEWHNVLPLLSEAPFPISLVDNVLPHLSPSWSEWVWRAPPPVSLVE